MKRFAGYLFILIFVSLVLSGCGKNDVVVPDVVQFDLAPVFREFYQTVGGEALLGKPLGETFEKDDMVFQYVVGGLLVSDPYLRDGRSVFFDDLGKQLGFYEPPHTTYDELAGTYLNGYEIHEAFVPLFTKMGGVEVVGYPISNANYNAEAKQIEQHFENLGFYLSDGEEMAFASVLPYGVYDCGSACSLNAFDVADDMDVLDATKVPEPFASFVQTLGGDFIGTPLTNVYDAGDGIVQMVFENLVLFTTVGNETRVEVLAIAELLGHTKENPVVLQESGAAYFYRVDGEYGYSIPNGVFDYVMAHGGLAVSGNPIQGVDKIADYHYRQCFEHMCFDIEVDPQTKDELIYPLSLGRDYEERFYQAPTPMVVDDVFELNVWLATPLVAKDAEQTIFAQVSNEARETLADIQLVMIVTYPADMHQERISLPLTDVGGLTQINIKPVDAANGSRVNYEICLEEGEICVSGKYTIWSE